MASLLLLTTILLAFEADYICGDVPTYLLLQEVDKTIQGLDGDIKEVDKTIQGLDGDIKEVDKTIQDLDEDMKEVNKTTQSLEGDMKDTLQRLERIEEINETTYNANEGIKEINETTYNANEGIKGILQRLDQMQEINETTYNANEGIKEINETTYNANEGIKEINETTYNANEGIKEINETTYNANEGIKEINETTYNANEGIKDILQRLDQMQEVNETACSPENGIKDILQKLEHIEEPTEEARRFMDQQSNTMNEILRKLDSIESEVSSLHHCCRSTQESFEWTKTLCSKAAKTCPGGWHAFKNSCYYVSNTPGKWRDGLRYCRGIGAEYVQISSFAEWDFVSGLFKEDTWIGLTDQDDEGTFRWSNDKSVPRYTKWMSGEPNDFYGNEDCVVSRPYHSNHWNDISCDNTYRFACEVTL